MKVKDNMFKILYSVKPVLVEHPAVVDHLSMDDWVAVQDKLTNSG